MTAPPGLRMASAVHVAGSHHCILPWTPWEIEKIIFHTPTFFKRKHAKQKKKYIKKKKRRDLVVLTMIMILVTSRISPPEQREACGLGCWALGLRAKEDIRG